MHLSPRSRIGFALVAAIVIVAAGAGTWMAWVRHTPAPVAAPSAPGMPPAEATLTPSRTDSAGIEPATSFRLTAARSLGTDEVRKALTVEPAVELKVERADLSGRQFTITPARALEPDRVYKFRLAASGGLARPYQWAFQTKAAFRVLGTLPRNQGTGVPLNTGIEITFSHENFTDPGALFSITPQAEGRFERHRKTLVFVPKEPLAPGTIYAVTLKKGLALNGSDAKLTDDFTFQFETQAPDARGGGTYLQLPMDVQEFPAGEAPYFQIYFSNGGKAQEQQLPTVGVTVFRYKDGQAYAAALGQVERVPSWAYQSRQRLREEKTEGLARAASFQVQAQNAGGSGPFVFFPEALPPGYYLAEFQAGGVTRQAHFQMTDISSYIAVTGTKTLVWLNDLAARAPVSGATLELVGGTARATTDKDGVAVIETPAGVGRRDGQSGVYLLAKAGGKEAVIGTGVPENYLYTGSTERGYQYWRYLYLDRELYKSDDTVNIWGIVRPREPGAVKVDEVTAVIYRNEYRDYDDKPVPLVHSTFKVDDGTFTGSLTLPDVRAGYYTAEIRMGEDFLLSRSFEVKSYAKPAYTIEVTPEKRAVFVGESAAYDVKAAFFEGTPLPGLQLRASPGGVAGIREVTTGPDGRATLTYTASVSARDDQVWVPEYQWTNFTAATPEVGELTASARTLVFARDVLFSPTVAVEGKEAVISGTVRQVDLGPYNRGETESYEGAPAAGRAISGTLIEENWVKQEQGEYYDFIAKTVQKQYSYQQTLKEIGTFTATTDGDGRFVTRLPIEEGKSYQVKVTAQDTQGRGTQRTLRFFGQAFRQPGSQGYRYFYLADPVPRTADPGLGEEIPLVMQESQAPVPDRAKGFLFFTTHLGLREYKVQDSSLFRFALKEGDLPAVNVQGVYFDGRMYRESRERPVHVNPKERELKVSVTTDKAEYRPGETVNVTVRVADRQGRPARAKVNLNLVDEALYALRGQIVDLPGNLYGQYVPSLVLRTRGSHVVPDPRGGAEKGGDGGGARQDFKDAVFFDTLTTDSAGTAAASFKVPDNLTSWRLTYQAVLPSGMEVASGTAAVPVRLPFFLDVVLGETSLAGDRPSVTVRAFGNSLSEGADVDLTVTVKDPAGQETQLTGRAKAFEARSFPLPEAKAGVWSVTVAGRSGSLTDSVLKRYTAVDSFLRRNRADFALLADGLKVKGAEKGITTLTFTDYERSRYLGLLQQMRWAWGNRVEQKLARTIAGELLTQYFGQEPAGGGGDADFAPFQAPDGSVSILPYADGDLLLSALAADAGGSRFDRAALALYFRKVLDDRKTEPDRAAIALYGMAAVGEPVLQAVESRLTDPSLGSAERLYLALAAAALGDLETARPAFYTLLAENGEQIGSTMRMKAVSDPDEAVSTTALAAALAGRLGEPQAAALVGYLLENPGKEVVVLLQEVVAVRGALPLLQAEPAAFTYVLDGKTERKELKPGEVFRLPVTAAALPGLQFKEVKGKVGVTAAYEAPLSKAESQQQAGFAVRRSYAVVGKGQAAEFAPGDLVEVTLSYTLPETAPGGTYELADYLPAGLRRVERPWVYYGAKNVPYKYFAWPLESDGQKVVFAAGQRADSTIVYYARAAVPGSFAAEGPVLSHQRSGLVYWTGERSQVRVTAP